MARRVDYDKVAPRYRTGRALSHQTVERWRRAAMANLGDGGPGLVVDVGAGTGLFIPVWKEWGADRVVGIEPSAAMRTEALGSGAAGRGSMIAGVAEGLPLRDRCADVVWMSTVFHQVEHRHAAVGEVARVLGPNGVWLVRGFFRDRSTVGWLEWFPGAERARGTYPSAAEAVELAGRHGLRLNEATEVESDARVTVADAMAWVTAMRAADTLLCALTDDEIGAGLAAMEAHRGEPCAPDRLTLLAFSAAP